MRRFCAGLGLLVLSPFILRADTPAAPAAARSSPDELLLQSAFLESDGPAVVEFFRRQAEPDVDAEQLQTWLADLAQPRAEVHRPAAAALVSLGVTAAPALRQAAYGLEDHDAAERARRCLRFVEVPGAASLASAAARVLAQRKPPGAAAALLAYLPSAPDDNVVRDLEVALAALAHVAGKIEPSLVQAVDNPVAARRGAAAAVLCKVGTPVEREAVRKLFRDPRPTVRMRAALGFGQHDDPEAIPLLIELLAELPAPQRMEVERFLAALAGTAALYVRPGESAPVGRLRRDVWAAWWQDTTGDHLLAEIRQRTLSDAQRAKLLEAIRQLGSEDAATRDGAAAEIVLKGVPAAALLRHAARDPDPVVRKNAAGCLQLIEKGTSTALPVTTVRLLGIRRPPGTVEALVAYLPFADTPDVTEKAQTVLAKLAFRDGEPEAVLVKALTDAVPARRLAAAELLFRQGSANLKDQARQLLHDPDLPTRLHFALSLLDHHEKPAVPVLISLLGELPVEQAVEAEDALRYLAGAQAPAVFLETDGSTTARCREAWQAWWQKQGDGLNLARLENNRSGSGLTLLLETPQVPGRGRLAMIDRHGQILWQFGLSSHVGEARPISEDRFLLVDTTTRQISERDTQGSIVWKYDLANNFHPLSARRLANGNTFIVCNNRLVEVDRTGKEVFHHVRQNYDIVSGRKWADGHVSFITNTGTYTRLDGAGKTVKSYHLPSGRRVFSGAYVELLPNDHVLLYDPQTGYKLTEFDARGQPCRQLTLPSHATAFERLANGHTVAVLGVSQVVELDRAGKTVWEFSDPSFRPYQARRVQ